MIRYVPGSTIVVTTATAEQKVDVKAGVMYRIVTDIDMWLTPFGSTGTGPVAANQSGMYFPAKVLDPNLYSFLPTDNATKTCKLSVYGAVGKMYLTEMIPVFGA